MLYQKLILSGSALTYHRQAVEELLNLAGCLGLEEFDVDEPMVDDFLGEESYAGGNLPLELIERVDRYFQSQANSLIAYFDKERSVRKFELLLAKANLELSIKKENLEDQDWNEEWKKHYSPIEVSQSFAVLPCWSEQAVRQKYEKFILINPGMGFGTGTHETTFLCLTFLSRYQFQGPCLDFGSGSGILGLGFHLFYPKELATLVEIDKEAHENAKENQKLNQFESGFEYLMTKDYVSNPKYYRLIFANILEHIIIEYIDVLKNSLLPGGYLILSGLLNEQVNNIKNYTKDLETVEVISKGDWSAVLLQKVVP